MSGTGVKITGLPAIPSALTGTEPVAVVRNGVTYQAPSDYLDSLAPSLSYATTLTGDEITGIVQIGERVLSTLNAQARLAANKRVGLVYDTIAQAVSLLPFVALPIGSMIATSAYAVPGDNGGSLYERVSFEPAHAGKFQDASGIWWELRSSIIRPEMFGAKADGVTDDTVALQGANTMLAPGQAMVLTAGRTYCVTEYVFPDLRSTGQLNGAGLVCPDGMACLKKIGAASVYLAATESWLQPSPGSITQYWPYAEGIIFDGNGLADFSYVGVSWRGRFVRCTFTGGVLAGCYLPSDTQAGIPVTGSRGNNSFMDCYFTSNIGHGIWGLDIVDVYIDGGFSSNNGGYGHYTRVGGWRVIGHKVYGNTLGPARYVNFGYGSVMVGCHFDLPGDVWIDGIQATNGTGRLMDCDFKCALRVTGESGSLVLDSPRFQTLDAYLMVGGQAGTQIIIDGGMADVSNPIRYQTFVDSTGIVQVENFFLGAKGGLFTGIVTRPATELLDQDMAPNLFRVRKTLSEGTVTTIVVDALMTNAQAASTLITADIDISTYQNAFNDFEVYQTTVKAGANRRVGSVLTGSYAITQNIASSDASGITVTPSWVFGGADSDPERPATLTISIAHMAPTVAGNTMLAATITAINRLVTQMAVV